MNDPQQLPPSIVIALAGAAERLACTVTCRRIGKSWNVKLAVGETDYHEGTVLARIAGSDPWKLARDLIDEFMSGKLQRRHRGRQPVHDRSGGVSEVMHEDMRVR